MPGEVQVQVRHTKAPVDPRELLGFVEPVAGQEPALDPLPAAAILSLDGQKAPDGDRAVSCRARRELVLPGVMVQSTRCEHFDVIATLGQAVSRFAHDRFGATDYCVPIAGRDEGDALPLARLGCHSQ